MTQNTIKPSSEIRLRCLSGSPAPAPVVEGWRRFLLLPEAARAGFLDLLAQTVKEPTNPQNKQRVESFCREHGLAEENALAAIRSCDFLLRQASALDLTTNDFSQDLSALSEGRTEEPKSIISRYDAIKTELRKAIIQESLADHGKILVGLDWRVDTVNASDRGAELNTNVVFLTLRYRDGDSLERITLQLAPEALMQLKRFTDRFGKPTPSAPTPGGRG